MMADLGHTTLDSADEYDYDIAEDELNYSPEGTPERVSILAHTPIAISWVAGWLGV